MSWEFKSSSWPPFPELELSGGKNIFFLPFDGKKVLSGLHDVRLQTSESVGMRRRFQTCAYQFLTTVTEGVVCGVHKVVIRTSFGVISRHKVI